MKAFFSALEPADLVPQPLDAAGVGRGDVPALAPAGPERRATSDRLPRPRPSSRPRGTVRASMERLFDAEIWREVTGGEIADRVRRLHPRDAAGAGAGARPPHRRRCLAQAREPAAHGLVQAARRRRPPGRAGADAGGGRQRASSPPRPATTGWASRCAAQAFDIEATVLVSAQTPEVKRAGIAALGATVEVAGATYDEAEAEARRRAADDPRPGVRLGLRRRPRHRRQRRPAGARDPRPAPRRAGDRRPRRRRRPGRRHRRRGRSRAASSCSARRPTVNCAMRRSLDEGRAYTTLRRRPDAGRRAWRARSASARSRWRATTSPTSRWSARSRSARRSSTPTGRSASCAKPRPRPPWPRCSTMPAPIRGRRTVVVISGGNIEPDLLDQLLTGGAVRSASERSGCAVRRRPPSRLRSGAFAGRPWPSRARRRAARAPSARRPASCARLAPWPGPEDVAQVGLVLERVRVLFVVTGRAGADAASRVCTASGSSSPSSATCVDPGPWQVSHCTSSSSLGVPQAGAADLAVAGDVAADALVVAPACRRRPASATRPRARSSSRTPSPTCGSRRTCRRRRKNGRPGSFGRRRRGRPSGSPSPTCASSRRIAAAIGRDRAAGSPQRDQPVCEVASRRRRRPRRRPAPCARPASSSRSRALAGDERRVAAGPSPTRRAARRAARSPGRSRRAGAPRLGPAGVDQRSAPAPHDVDAAHLLQLVGRRDDERAPDRARRAAARAPTWRPSTTKSGAASRATRRASGLSTGASAMTSSAPAPRSRSTSRRAAATGSSRLDAQRRGQRRIGDPEHADLDAAERLEQRRRQRRRRAPG